MGARPPAKRPPFAAEAERAPRGPVRSRRPFERSDERGFEDRRPEERDGEPRRSGPPRRERVRREPTDLRSFDGSPRRGRSDDWDIDAAAWAPEADLDIDAVEEPRTIRREPAGERRTARARAPREEAPRREEARPPRRAPAPAPAGPTRAELKAAATDTLQTGVQTLTVTEDEADMRVDRFLAARFPQLSFSYIQRIVRKGELRVNGRRVETKDRLEAGQAVRVPPLKLDQARPMSAKVGEDVAGFLASITLYEDADVMVLAKPAGLAVQGGSGTKKHLDGMLAVLTDEDGQRPRLVHRLDKDTSGCLLVAKSRFAAAALAKTFRTRAARKIYWSVVAGVPKPRQGRVSTYLAKEEREDESFMRIAKHGEKGASHAVSYYAVIDTMAQKLSWLSMKPVTGRTHQLRVHAAEIGHPILGDPKYFDVENWEIPGGIQHKLHLHARRIVVPHPRGKGTIDVSAPLPPHMEQTFNLLGWDVSRYDPIVEAPEE
ncbi:RluA family pseudouridine synthase [Phreatobacter cathodiphilus]|uniref:Ribosomal large subunit pseudouridine synthase D n=2 Tax=Phreatobacter cathodiphilus TaxID=1868589 RepID=A0A2S0NHY3_9HYPH|nr:RluA family pseudouridine synthase [Phreatobacter cathodiphilus]